MKIKTIKQRFFLDTNILIYCFDQNSPTKQKQSRELVAFALSSGLGLISHQVVQEFVSVAATKFRKVFGHEQLVLYLDEVLFGLWKAYPSREMYMEGLQLQRNYKLSWWDSLILASALETGCRTVFSEDFQRDLKVETVQVVNPFL